MASLLAAAGTVGVCNRQKLGQFSAAIAARSRTPENAKAPPREAAPSEYQVALQLLAGGSAAAAVEKLAEFLNGTPSTSSDFVPAKRLFETLRSSVAELQLQFPAEDVVVLLDGKVCGVAPLDRTVFVQPGPHQLVVIAGTDAPVTRALVLRGGQRLSLRLRARQ